MDIPSEIIYIKDEEKKKGWSLGLNPMPDDKNYNIIYGFGICKYIHKSDGIEQKLQMFVPKKDSCKISILTLKIQHQIEKIEIILLYETSYWRR